MKCWKLVAFLLCQVSGLKYEAAPECSGDVTGAKIFECDEQAADADCAKKYTVAGGDVHIQCAISGPNCLAVGPFCKKTSAASMTCSGLSDCESKGWKKTWTSGTATKYSVALGTHVLLGYVKENGEMSHAWYFKTPDSWKTTHPYNLQHQGDIIEAIRASDGTKYEGELVSDYSNYGGGCECGKGSGHWGRICLRSKTPPGGGWKCHGKGGAVPKEIDFPYIRGYGRGNGCGSSSLSFYNWNSGPKFCGDYKVVIMTN